MKCGVCGNYTAFAVVPINGYTETKRQGIGFQILVFVNAILMIYACGD